MRTIFPPSSYSFSVRDPSLTFSNPVGYLTRVGSSGFLTFSSAVCRVAEPIALTSCFPYAWVMVRDFHVGDGSNASFYAGLFISAFSFAESLTGMFWGCLSDRMGRKPVLLIGCGGTMLSMLVVGFAPNFWVALVGRALGGLLSMDVKSGPAKSAPGLINSRWKYWGNSDHGRRNRSAAGA